MRILGPISMFAESIRVAKLQLNRITAVLLIGVFLCASLQGSDGTWISDGKSGSYDTIWENSANWWNGVVADGVDSTAFFNAPDLSDYLTVNEDHDLGYLCFFQGSPCLIYGDGRINMVTSEGQPSIKVFEDAMGSVFYLNGDQGVIKYGDGTLWLYYPEISGNVVVAEGTLRTGYANFDRDVSITIESGATYYTAWKRYDDEIGSLSGSGKLVLNLGRTYFGADDQDSEFSGTIAGSGSFGKAGTGTMILSGENTFTGTTTITGGTLQLGNELALQKSTVELSSGLDINGYNPTFGGITGENDYDLGEATVLTVGTNNKDCAYSGVLGGAGAQLVKVGDGTLALSGDNSYDGGTILKDGKILVTSKSQLNLANSKLTMDGGILATQGYGFTSLYEDEMIWGENGGGFDIEGVLDLHKSLAGNGALVKQGIGRLSLYGDNSAMTGDVHVQAGKLVLHHSTNSIGDTSLVTVDSGATLEFDWGKPSERIGALAGGGSFYLGNDGELTVGDHRDTEFSGIIRGDIDDAWDVSGKLIKVGTGTLTLSGDNPINRGIELREGTLSVSRESNLSVYDNCPLVFDGGFLQITGTGLASLSRDITWGDGGAGFDIVDEDHTFTVSDAITGNGGLTKRGDGTLHLSGNLSHEGDTVIEGGALRLTGHNAASGGAITVWSGGILLAGLNDSIGSSTRVGVLTGGTFRLEGDEIFGSLIGAGSVDTAGFGLGVGLDNTDTTFSGVISGAGYLAKRGTGMLTLSGNNTYTGPTEIFAGTLKLTGDNRDMSGTVSIGSGATLRAGIGNSLGFDTRVVVGAGGTFTLEGDEDFGSLSGAGSVDTAGFGMGLGYDNADTTFAGTLSGYGDLTKAGTGTFTLSGTNAWDLTNIDVARGTLAVTGDLTVGSSSGAGHLTVGSGANLTVGGNVNICSNGTLDGSGTLTGHVTNLGTVGPGNSPGLLTVAGDYTQAVDAILEMELAGLTRGTEYDVLAITGQMSLAGTLRVMLLDGFDPVAGDSFDILDFGTLAGQFDTLLYPILSDGLYWDNSALYATGTLSVGVATVPTPSALVLLLAGLGAVGIGRRRTSKPSRCV